MLTREHSSTQTQDYQSIFHDSYLRCVVGDQDGFFKRFYELFTAADSGVSRVFAETNMERQISMLQESLLYMIHFANSKTASVRMQRVATYHGSNELDVPSHLFDLWMDCLVTWRIAPLHQPKYAPIWSRCLKRQNGLASFPGPSWC